MGRLSKHLLFWGGGGTGRDTQLSDAPLGKESIRIGDKRREVFKLQATLHKDLRYVLEILLELESGLVFHLIKT